MKSLRRLLRYSPLGVAYRSWKVGGARRRSVEERTTYRPLDTRAEYAEEARALPPLLTLWEGENSAVRNPEIRRLAYRRVKQFLDLHDGWWRYTFKGLLLAGPPVSVASVFIGLFMAWGFGVTSVLIGTVASVILCTICIGGGYLGRIWHEWRIGFMPLHIIERAKPLDSGEWVGPWWDDPANPMDEQAMEELANAEFDPTVLTHIVETVCNRLIKVDDVSGTNFYPGPTDGKAGIMHATMRLALPLGEKVEDVLTEYSAIFALPAKRHTLVPTYPVVNYNWTQDEVTIGEEDRREEEEQEGKKSLLDHIRDNKVLLGIGVAVLLILMYSGESSTIKDLKPLLEATATAVPGG